MHQKTPVFASKFKISEVGETSQIYHKIVIDSFGSVFTALKIVIDRSFGQMTYQ